MSRNNTSDLFVSTGEESRSSSDTWQIKALDSIIEITSWRGVILFGHYNQELGP